jgi:DNA-binding NtrC family response regulator
VVALLTRHAWPGNIRELRNLLERAVLLSGGEPLAPEHFPQETFARAAIVPTSSSAVPEDDLHGDDLHGLSLDDAQRTERARILEALASTAGNQSRAAKMLGISRNVLVNRIASYRIPRPRGG